MIIQGHCTVCSKYFDVHWHTRPTMKYSDPDCLYCKAHGRDLVKIYTDEDNDNNIEYLEEDDI